MTFQIQDNCGPADQRVHTNQDNEQGREAEEQQRESNIGGATELITTFLQKNYISQVTAGVREYFNVMLSSQLLYRQDLILILKYFIWSNHNLLPIALQAGFDFEIFHPVKT